MYMNTFHITFSTVVGRERENRLTFLSGLSVAATRRKKGGGEFVSRADLSVAATRQRKKFGESHGDFCVSLRI